MDVSVIASVGIDLGKTTFHLVALDCHAKVVVRKKFSRSQLLAFHRESAVVDHRHGSQLGRTFLRS